MEPQDKANLIRIGINDVAATAEAKIQLLCLAIGYLTSPDKSKRETAKRRIREYVEIGKNKTGE